jgi:diacylglycerol kinase
MTVSEKPPRKTGIAHFFAAAGYSAGGARRLWREAAFRQELLGLAGLLALFLIVGASSGEVLGLLLLGLMVLAVEALNTALEELVDPPGAYPSGTVGDTHVHPDRIHAEPRHAEIPARPDRAGAWHRRFPQCRSGGRLAAGARVFAVEGVTGVFFGTDFVTVTKAEGVEWAHIKPAILGAIMEHYQSGAPVMEGEGRATGAGPCRT